MDKVYVESTVISYLTARPSRDIVVAGHQALTAQWWQTAKMVHELYVSQAVLDEIRSGDSEQAAKRLELVQGLSVLEYSQEVVDLIAAYDRSLGLTGRAKADLPHIGFAVAAEMDFLVTWNCQHLASAAVIRRLQKINVELGRKTPLLERLTCC
jgi:hypothetical protein